MGRRFCRRFGCVGCLQADVAASERHRRRAAAAVVEPNRAERIGGCNAQRKRARHAGFAAACT
ncbi:hypothetical protein D9M72_350770 [compost metagenome]